MVHRCMCSWLAGLALVLLSACSAGPQSPLRIDAPPPPPPPPIEVVGLDGVWFGALAYQGGTRVSVHAVAFGSEVRMGLDNLDELVLSASRTGGTLTLTGQRISAPSTAWPGVGVPFSLSGTVDASRSFSGTWSGGGFQGVFALSPGYRPPVPTALPSLAGRWKSRGGMYDSLGMQHEVTMDGAGTFSGKDWFGRPLSGRLTRLAPDLDLFRVEASLTLPNGLVRVVRGLCFLAASFPSGIYGTGMTWATSDAEGQTNFCLTWEKL